VELAIPKLRQGTDYPEWLPERRRRAERALATVVATSYLLGVSTRRVEKLAESLGVTKLAKSQVSVMAAELDEMVASFRSRPLDAELSKTLAEFLFGEGRRADPARHERVHGEVHGVAAVRFPARVCGL
jgi:transposase-like protein